MILAILWVKVYEITLREYILIYRPLIVKVVTGYLGNILYTKSNLNRFVTNKISTSYHPPSVTLSGDTTVRLVLNSLNKVVGNPLVKMSAN